MKIGVSVRVIFQAVFTALSDEETSLEKCQNLLSSMPILLSTILLMFGSVREMRELYTPWLVFSPMEIISDTILFTWNLIHPSPSFANHQSVMIVIFVLSLIFAIPSWIILFRDLGRIGRRAKLMKYCQKQAVIADSRFTESDP